MSGYVQFRRTRGHWILASRLRGRRHLFKRTGDPLLKWQCLWRGSYEKKIQHLEGQKNKAGLFSTHVFTIKLDVFAATTVRFMACEVLTYDTQHHPCTPEFTAVTVEIFHCGESCALNTTVKCRCALNISDKCHSALNISVKCPCALNTSVCVAVL